jgi:non-ribosomal peptide synthetase component E (peptide arylation enzyme)
MRTIHEAIDGHAQVRPDAPFLFAPELDITITHAALRGTARALAAELVTCGVSPGDVVSYMLPNGVAAANIFLGAMYGGYVVSPVSLIAQDALIEHALRIPARGSCTRHRSSPTGCARLSREPASHDCPRDVARRPRCRSPLRGRIMCRSRDPRRS